MRNTVMSLVFMSLGLTSAHADLGDVVKSSGVTGGVVVHLWCADGRETVKLCRSDSYSVQGLDDDTAKIEACCALVRGMGGSDNIFFDTFDGVHLPYVDNMVNLIIDEGRTDGPESVSEIELLRVSCPAWCCHAQERRYLDPFGEAGAGEYRSVDTLPARAG